MIKPGCIMWHRATRPSCRTRDGEPEYAVDAPYVVLEVADDGCPPFIRVLDLIHTGETFTLERKNVDSLLNDELICFTP